MDSYTKPNPLQRIRKEKSAKILKNRNKGKKFEAQNLAQETLDNMKENITLNEGPSNRYSEVVFKDNVFDSKDESSSGINELNLLQELTNFTNMKMLRNNKNAKQKQQHCIHFDRVIKN